MTIVDLGKQPNDDNLWGTNYYLLNRQLMNDKKLEKRKQRCCMFVTCLLISSMSYGMGILTCHLSDIC